MKEEALRPISRRQRQAPAKHHRLWFATYLVQSPCSTVLAHLAKSEKFLKQRAKEWCKSATVSSSIGTALQSALGKEKVQRKVLWSQHLQQRRLLLPRKTSAYSNGSRCFRTGPRRSKKILEWARAHSRIFLPSFSLTIKSQGSPAHDQRHP